MMTSTLCTYTWLLLPCCVLVTLSTGELDFYRDEVREPSENIVLRQIMKYVQGQRAHFSPLNRLKERDLLEALINKGSLADILLKEKPKGWNHRQMRYNEPINERPQRGEPYSPFYGITPIESSLEFPNFRFPFVPRETYWKDGYFLDDGYEEDRNPPVKQIILKETNFNKGMNEEPLLDFHGSYHGSMVNVDDDGSDVRKIQKPHVTTPEFKFKFDDSNLRESHPFAVKPNDPRYYQETFFSDDSSDKMDFEKVRKNNTKWDQENKEMEKIDVIKEESPRNVESKFKDTSMIMFPELERRTKYNPLFVPVNQDFNNDIYFTALFAGCSAVIMCVLVLIALTCYRVKWGAKAAADIEYPAYGVTGPNKEVSPSGDQRLAQSAQMYHFQHQKQQIIAMEKDPGSVSEAESEEENEEGDYTVYECPGLASTGEMEVKNPLFHDDPTPVTPAQMCEQEDHDIYSLLMYHIGNIYPYIECTKQL
ncbi:Neural proliferation differentiation and control protein 1 [Anthophora quadrimaculata]